ncbi:MAG: S8 family peptidase [Dermatophilaceae bacterium]
MAAVARPGPRQRRPPGFGRTTTYVDRRQHGHHLEQQVSSITAAYQGRPQTVGVEPDLVLVLDTNGQLDPTEIERAGLTVLELRSDRVLIAFSADPEMAEFRSRNARYQQGTRGLTEKGNERAAHYEQLFDRIDDIRTLEPADIIGAELAAALRDRVGGHEVRRLEIHCWCPDDPDLARRRHGEVRSTVESAGGTVVASAVRPAAGWSVICCDLPLSAVDDVVATQRVSWVDLMARPALTSPQLHRTAVNDLPAVSTPRPDAPILAVIDSGIRSAHPLLAPAVIGAEVVGPGLGDAGDESGHGTLVASLGLYGSLEPVLADRSAVTPAGRLLGVRVLNADNQFPDDVIWAELLLEAMELAIAAGARVLNVSLGDPRRPYHPPRPSAVGALIDQFIRAHPHVVVVTCTGNVSVAQHEVARLLSTEYVDDLLRMPDTGILDPGTSALALTVGGVGTGDGQGAGTPSAERIVVGGPRVPSPHTRVGPGPMYAVKPELAAPSGSVVVDTFLGRANVMDALGHVVGAGGARPDRLLASDQGTSFAAPLVSHAALRVLGRYPQLTGNSVRALLLAGSAGIPEYLSPGADGRSDERRLTGFGLVAPERSEVSSDHRVVMLSESRIQLDEVHLYRVPVPSSFRAPGGRIGVAAALAFDPPVRVSRLDYLASRMQFQIFHGPSVEQVRNAYVVSPPDDDPDDDGTAAPQELQRYQVDLHPADQTRSRGANQFGRYSRSRKVAEDRPDEFVVAVRSLNRWDVPQAEQSYSLAILLERDDRHQEIYAELRAQLDVLAEVETEVETQVSR